MRISGAAAHKVKAAGAIIFYIFTYKSEWGTTTPIPINNQ